MNNFILLTFYVYYSFYCELLQLFLYMNQVKLLQMCLYAVLKGTVTLVLRVSGLKWSEFPPPV